MNLVQSFLRRFDLRVVGNSRYEQMKEAARMGNGIELLMSLPAAQLPRLLKLTRTSKSQLGQDLFVLSELEFKEKGFFVEFGATNGIDLSNTYLLEKEFGWKGILAEPARCWHESLRKNRNACIEETCVWKDSNSILEFNEASFAELSTIDAYSGEDLHGRSRSRGTKYAVRTISLNDLLAKYDAPSAIDYLSIDTEGSELEILKNLDFERYSFRVISCEHNFTPAREGIQRLLERNGYTRRLAEVSSVDDWYVRSRDRS